MLHEPPPAWMLIYLVPLNKLRVEHSPLSKSYLARNKDTTVDPNDVSSKTINVNKVAVEK
jgi:predicted AlkP superfamily pyrophosphatase or phosphodiesterase